MAEYADYYREIYARGLAGEQPAIPVSIAELEERAVEAMEPRARAYVCAGAGSEETMRANREAFRRWRIVPRMLRDVSERSLQVELLGIDDSGAGPAGADRGAEDRPRRRRAGQRPGRRGPGLALCHQHRRRLLARGGRRGLRRRPSLVPALLARRGRDRREHGRPRREARATSAIVVTVDTFMPGWKPRDLQQAWLPFLEGTGTANYFEDPVFREGAGAARPRRTSEPPSATSSAC